MTQIQAFRLDSPPSFGGCLHGFVHLPDLDKFSAPRPTVVICHGFKGFMEWGFFPPLADLLCERGFVAVRFNYSGSGMQPGDELVTDLDAFRRNTFSLELQETQKILGSLEEIAPSRVDPSRIGLLGHSRGGAAAVLAAASAPWVDRIGALVTWAALCSFERYAQHEVEWRRQGVLPTRNGRTGQELELGIELLEDLRLHPEELDLAAASARIRAPWSIVHGTDDEAVPFSEAHDFAGWATTTHQVVEIKDGSHTFGARHPFVGPTPELVRAMNATQLWFRRHLGS